MVLSGESPSVSTLRQFSIYILSRQLNLFTLDSHLLGIYFAHYTLGYVRCWRVRRFSHKHKYIAFLRASHRRHIKIAPPF